MTASLARTARHPIKPIAMAVLCALLAGSAGCTPRLDARGNLPDPAKIAEITIGKHGRDDVGSLLGSPSTISVFDGETWFYISKRTETVAFLAPETIDQKVVIVRFDAGGVVRAIETVGLDQARSLEPVARETPTMGKELNAIQQVLGNLGRFNKPADKK